MVDVHRDQADIISEVLFGSKLLNLLDELPAKFASTKVDPLTHAF
jgi:hypothetical protein